MSEGWKEGLNCENTVTNLDSIGQSVRENLP